jgi:hypothetical protein
MATMIACSAPAEEASSDGDSEEALTEDRLTGVWRFDNASPSSNTMSGLTLKADHTYVGEILRPCVSGEAGEPAGCEPVAVRGTWDFRQEWCGNAFFCGGRLTLHHVGVRYGEKRDPKTGEQEHIEISMTLHVSAPVRNSKKLIEVRTRLTQEGDTAPLAFLLGSAPINVRMLKLPADPGFCAASSDCGAIAGSTSACERGTSRRRVCTADRTCVSTCMPAHTAGYGDPCGALPELPSSAPRVTCSEGGSADASLYCLDNLAGGHGYCRIAP